MTSFQAIYSLKEIDNIAQILCNQFGQYKVWIFIGNLGSGKTTLIQSICKYWKVKDIVNSPSFSIVQIYQISTHQIYHIDFYRIRNLEEALHIGIEDMLTSNDFCFIEWPQVIDPLLKKLPHITIKIDRENDIQRKLNAIVSIVHQPK